MSSDSEAALIAQGFFNVQTNYLDVAAAALLAYEILVTYDREVACIWKRKISAVTIIFISLRYMTLLSQVLSFASDVIQPITTVAPCQVIGHSFAVANVWSRAASAIFSSLRIWAIWDRSWLLLVIVLLISLFPVAADLYQAVAERSSLIPLPSPLGGCSSTINLSPEALMRLGITTRTCAIVADVITVTATWIKTWSISQVFKSSGINPGQSRLSISGLLIRDGTLYFAALLCLNIASLVMDTTPNVNFNPVAAFIDTFTAIILSRLILNLRLFDNTITTTTTDDFGQEHVGTTNARRQISSARFANAVLDNIGASVSTFSDSTAWGGDWDGDLEEPESSDPGDVTGVTLDEVIKNPLAIGMKDDLRRR